MSLTVSIGCDPEGWCREKATGRVVSAHDLLPGTKDKPFPVERGAVQVDGVAAEFNIDPSYDPQGFTTSISAVTGKLQSMLGEKYELLWEPTCEFAEDYFKTLPLNVRELGCNPDFNAWTGQVNERPDGETTFLRTAAGHVHLGWYPKGKEVDPTDTTHFEDCCAIVKQLDYYLGAYSLMWDPDTKRRSLYGKAGSFRPKPYGLEYRSLSNVWLRSQKLQSWVWSAAYKAITDLVSGRSCLEDEFGDLARNVIDGNIEWWEDPNHKMSGLSVFTNLQTPPPLPKAGEKPKEPDPDVILTGALNIEQYTQWFRKNSLVRNLKGFEVIWSPDDQQYILRRPKTVILDKKLKIR